MFFQPSSDIRLAGSGVVTLDSMSIICSTVALTPEDERVHRSLHDSTVVSKYWLEPTRISLSGETLTSGVEKKIELDSLHGHVSHLLLAINATSSSNTGDKNNQYVSLGPTGTVDLLSVSGQSVLGSGTAINERLLRTWIYQKHFPNSIFAKAKSLYLIPFSDSTRFALALGQRSGSYFFDGSRHHLAITPSSAGTAEVQTLTQSSALAGPFKLLYRGE